MLFLKLSAEANFLTRKLSYQDFFRIKKPQNFFLNLNQCIWF